MNYEEYERLKELLLGDYVSKFIAIDDELREEKRDALYADFLVKLRTLYAQYQMKSKALYERRENEIGE